MRKRSIIKQTNFIDSIQKPNDPLVSIDARAIGTLKRVVGENTQTQQLYFISNIQAEDDRHYFYNENDLANYLKGHEKIETWEILDERIERKIYFHREPFGDMEHFTSEKELNKTLSSEGGGRWIIEYVKDSPNNLERIGMIDISSWWQTAFLQFTTQTAFQKASDKQEAEQLSWRKKLGWGLLGLLAGGLAHVFYQNTLIQSTSELEIEENTLHGLNSPELTAQKETANQMPWFTLPSLDAIFISQRIMQAAVSYGVGLSLAQRAEFTNTASIMSLFSLLSTLPSSSAEMENFSNSTFVESIYGLTTPSKTLKLPDNTFFMTAFSGGCKNILLSKIGTNGTVFKTKSLSGMDKECFWYPASALMTDNNIAVAAYTDGFGALLRTFLLAKTTLEGDLLWAYTIGSNLRWGIQNLALAPANDGSVVLTSQITDTARQGKTFFSLTKVSNEGALQWSFTYSPPMLPTSITIRPNENIVVTGSIEFSGLETKVVLAEFTGKGKPLWAGMVGGKKVSHYLQSSTGNDVALSPNGNIFVTGHIVLKTPSNGLYFGSLLAQWNRNGTLLWGNVLKRNGIHETHGYSVEVTNSDNEMLVAGIVDRDMLLSKWYKNGTLSWGKTGNFAYQVKGAQAIASGNNIFITSYGGTTIFAKLNSTGSLANCSNIKPILPYPYWEVENLQLNFSTFTINASLVRPELTNIMPVIIYKNVTLDTPKQLCPSSQAQHSEYSRNKKISELPHLFQNKHHVITSAPNDERLLSEPSKIIPIRP